MSSSRLRLFSVVLAALWAVLVWELCTSTKITTGQRFWWSPWAYNLAHAPLFGLLAAFLGLALAPSEVRGGWRGLLRAVPAPEARRAAFLAGAVLVIGYGVLLEWVQSRIPGRSADGMDVVLDAVGALGVPWGLSSGGLFGWRTWVVFGVAGALAAWITWGPR